ncbi:MAG: hypothetical protein JNG89_02315 [Planctomycetaceae bacterium]|nr:hypothetical protein [Planctomycetaceae bacterium]
MIATLRCALTVLFLAVCFRQIAAAEQQLYAPPPEPEIRRAAIAWAQDHGADPELLKAVESQWDFQGAPSSPDDRFDALIRTFYLVDPEARELIDACRSGDLNRLATGFPLLETQAALPLFHENLRYFFARYLAVLTMYDEALDLFARIDPAHVVDPAGCLFYKAVCEHSLLLKEDGLATLKSLLTSTEDVPVRYSTVATLMQADLEALQEQSLDEVARQMRDVERRLTLGRAGQQVQRVEDRIVNTLDEIIAKIEQQQGGGGGGGGSQGGEQSPDQAPTGANDSYVGGIKGKGEVDPEKLGHKDGWGELPDKAQAAAKELINQQFPFHYRQAVEEYLKRIAQRSAGNE